ncbi:MAG: peptidylprolyl isomerase [Burkholderiaceae bacterium]
MSKHFLAGLAIVVATSASAQNIAVVNGRPIPKERADLFLKELAKQGQQSTPELAALVRQELVDREILLQEAEKRGLPAVSEFKFQIETARTQILIQALVQDELGRNPIKDEDIQAEYQRLTAQLNTEYRARHILVETEAMAKDILARLNKGEKFEALAKSLSKDPGSAANGGDLDWASADTFVGPFSEAMVKLEKGKTTSAPVQTQFGWHVIRLDDVRKSQPPALAEVRDQIAESLQRKKLSEFQQTLKGRAKIQ